MFIDVGGPGPSGPAATEREESRMRHALRGSQQNHLEKKEDSATLQSNPPKPPRAASIGAASGAVEDGWAGESVDTVEIESFFAALENRSTE